MIGKTTKQKRRGQAREAALIRAALMAAVHPEAGTSYNGSWLTCQALNELEGIEEIPAEAAYLARFPRGRARAEESRRTSPALCAALQYSTVADVLERAGLL